MLCDYQCKECKFVFEELVSANDPNPTCIKCECDTIKLFPLIAPTLMLATVAYNNAMGAHNSTKHFMDK